MIRPALLALGIALMPSAASAEPTPVATASAIDPARLAKAREVIELVVPAAEREKMFETAVNAMLGNMVSGMIQADPKLASILEKPELKRVFGAFIERQRQLGLADIRNTLPELVSAYVNAYARRFSVEELEDLRRFFATATGAKYTRSTGELLQDSDFAAWQRHVAGLEHNRRGAEIKPLIEEITPLIQQSGKHDHAS